MSAAGEFVRKFIYICGGNKNAAFTGECFKRKSRITRNRAVLENSRRRAATKTAIQNAEHGLSTRFLEPSCQLFHRDCRLSQSIESSVVGNNPVIMSAVTGKGEDNDILRIRCSQGIVQCLTNSFDSRRFVGEDACFNI